MVKIVTDTTASLNLDEYQKYGITAVPLYICSDGATQKEVYEITYDQFYAQQRGGKKFTTSQPDPNSFLEVFKPAVEAGDEVICITLSGGISGTVNSANIAAQMLETDKITIVDSLQSGFGQANLAIKAAEMAASGCSRAEIVSYIEDLRSRTKVYFMVESLRYLYEGGRLSGAQALIGSIIQVKPIIWFDETGKMVAYEKIRTLKAARTRLLEIIAERKPLGIEQVALHYGDNYEEAAEFAKSLETVTETPITLIKLSPVIAAHTGPDLLGPCVITKQP